MHLFVVLEKMKGQSRQRGISLTEMIIVIAGVAVLSYFAVPAGRVFLRSFESTGGARAMISAAMASARAIAAREHRYAGIRFQKTYDPANPDPLKAPQYMIFIVHDPQGTSLAKGFRAVRGLEPVRLPDSVGVMDLQYNLPGDGIVDDDREINTWPAVTDTTSFSIIFSPSGKLLSHDVRIVGIGNDIFGAGGMFLEDGADAGLAEEPSRKSFVIYDRRAFRQAYDQRRPWSGYLVGLVDEMIYVNPYTGTLINR